MIFKNKIWFLIILALIVAVPTSIVYQQEDAPLLSAFTHNEAENFPIDQIIIKFNNASNLEAAILTENFTFAMQTLSKTAGVQLDYQRPMSGNAHILRLPEKMAKSEVALFASHLAQLEGVEYAEPDYLLQITGQPETTLLAADFVPNDPFYADQWHYRYTPGTSEGINLEPAWNQTRGNGIVVAVLDSGVLLNHVDLAGQTVSGYDFISDPSRANDGGGRDNDPSDPGNWTIANECGTGSSATPSSWHGTHVAGTIAARTHDGKGVAGIAGESKILPVRVSGKCGAFTSDLIEAIYWSAGYAVPGIPQNNNPAQVINISLGGLGSCPTFMQDAITAAINAETTVVVSAGNDNLDASAQAPANCAGVITVGATNRTGNKASYSNYGAAVEVSAPGGEVSSGNGANGVLSAFNTGTTTPGNDAWAFSEGTSMASPHVAGVVALILTQNGSLTPANVSEILMITARGFPAGSTCTNGACGAGIVDATAAVTCAAAASSTAANNTVITNNTTADASFFIYLPFIKRSIC